MKTNKSKDKWIQAGYFLFAEVGPKNISIKRLAEIADLPRTNFYYHFKDNDELIDEIIILHMAVAEEYLLVIKDDLKSFLPDLHIISVRYPLGLKFVKQLFLNREIKKYNDLYNKLNKIPISVIVPKMLSYYKLDVDYKIAQELWITVLDTWYSRLDVNNMNLEVLCELTDDILKSVFNFSA